MTLLTGMVVRIHCAAPQAFRACAETDCKLPFCGEVDTVCEIDDDAFAVRLAYRDWLDWDEVTPICHDCRTICEPVAHTINPASRFGRSITLYVCNECAASRRAEG